MAAVSGEAGDFQVELVSHPRYIDPDKCTGCGECKQHCPVDAIDEFNQGLCRRTATYIQYSQAIPLTYTIDRDVCIGCGLCEKVCLAHAPFYDDRENRRQLNVGAVILALGNDAFKPGVLTGYNYVNHPNIITSLEFERILSASGPYQGHLLRPYDLEEPRRIAWLQCVGSRDINQCGHSYCSAVCCMYAIKEAVIAKSHSHGELDTAIFFMDMRTMGKDFEKYHDRARDQYGVRFIRSRVHSINPAANGNLSIDYVGEDGLVNSEEFDLVVLSVGFEVSEQVRQLASRLNVELDAHGFAQTLSQQPVATSRPGIFVCGAFQGPKDIPQSVMEASAAAAAVGTILSPVRGTMAQSREFAQPRSVVGEPPRIGVFVCHCGINIGGIVDVPGVRDYARTLPYVEYVADNLYTCSQDTQLLIKQAIEEHRLNRVVVAACTPRTHEPLFQETLIDAGLNKYLFEMANIRNQDSWVHNDPQEATAKAKDLVRMAVAKAALLEPLDDSRVEVKHAAVVVGGGLAGMAAALSIAQSGYPVHLIEKEERLGGNACNLYRTWQGEKVTDILTNMVREVENHPQIIVHLNSRLKNVDGFMGNFTSVIESGGEEQTIEHGVAVVATGAKELKPDQYLYGEDPRVLTHQELDARFMEDDPALEEVDCVAFIQCVGSREPGRPYCSRVCCTHTVQSALEIKRCNPHADVFVLYRDLRTYGEREDLYQQARAAGVLFIRHDLNSKPEVFREGEKLRLRVTDPVIDRQVILEPDLLVLASAVVPPKDEQMAQFFKVALNEDGFFIEAHAKLRPVDFATDGVYLCGLAHYPKSIDESIAQGQAAAARALTLLAKDRVEISGMVAQVNPLLCSSCGVCVTVCPFSAPRFNDKGVSEINPALCKGCGLCVASCRSGAINLKGFDEPQIFAMIDSL